MPNMTAITSDPESFLKNNLLLIQYQAYESGYRNPGVKRFLLNKEDDFTCMRKGTGIISQFKEKTVDVWSIKSTTPQNANGWDCYWLPYDQDFKHVVVLESDADVMFTPAMDGCSFGFTNHGGGVYSASHGNLQTPMGRIDEAGLRQGMRFHKSTLHKSDYMNVPGQTDVKVTMVGVRKGNKWRFFYQQYLDQMGAFYLLKVQELKS